MEFVTKFAGQQLAENVDAVSEPSRLVRLAHLMFKCFVMLLLAFVAMLAACYFALRDFLNDDEMGKIMMKTLEVYFPNDTVARKLVDH